MATVRFSGEIRNDILHHARLLFAKRITAAQDNYPDDWGRQIYELSYKKHLVAMAALPDGFLKTADQFAFAGFRGGGWDTNVNRRMQLPFGGSKQVVNNGNAVTLGYHPDSPYNGQYLNAEDPRWDTIRPAYLTYCTEIRRLTVEQHDFTAGVEKVVNAYQTLGPALKAWPPLWELVSESIRERHRQIVPRREKNKAPEIEGVDLNSLTGTAAASKITQ